MPSKYYPNLHYWLFIPFLIILWGFKNYWLNFNEASFKQHLHSLSATLWFIFLIIQPWIYHKKSIKLHRKVGMIGLLVAGMVTATAFLMIQNMMQVNSGPFLVMKYSLSLIDVFLVAGFLVSVVMAILNAKDTPSHARWMIATIFWIANAATFRISVGLQNTINPSEPLSFELILAANFVFPGLVILLLMIKDYVKEKRLYNAFLLVMIINFLSAPMLLYLNDVGWIQAILENIFL